MLQTISMYQGRNTKGHLALQKKCKYYYMLIRHLQLQYILRKEEEGRT